MKLSVIGTGYVGLVSGTCFAEMGNTVYCVDSNEKKIEALQNGVIPIYEPGLEHLVKKNVENQSLTFSLDIKTAINQSEIVFIAVGTPQSEDGSADLQYVLAVATSIGQFMTKSLIVVNKSTVPVGTAEKVKKTIQAELEKRSSNIAFDVVSNPEFLKEGAAIADFLKPDRVVVGAEKESSMDVMRELYAPFTHSHERFIGMDVKSAEMTKYAANCMLATKISFMNEMSNICEAVGADINMVRLGIGSDSRIGYKFIYPGVGYGGSCFPKDVQALIKTSKANGYVPKIITAVEEVNKEQKKVIVNKIVVRFGENLNGLVFGIWGLSFKPETDDMRESASITIVTEIIKRGGKVKAYDPKAMNEAKTHYFKDMPLIEYVSSKYSAVSDVDAMILITEWKEFRSPDWDEVTKRMKQKIIFDGRNQYNAKSLSKQGFEYYQIGVKK